MYNFISILILIVCVLLVLIVLVQNSKGGGLASNFAETGQMMGVRKTADFLEKATWTLAGARVLLSLVAVAALPHRGETESKSMIEEQVRRTTSGAMPTELPAVPTGDTAQSQPAEQSQPIESSQPTPAE